MVRPGSGWHRHPNRRRIREAHRSAPFTAVHLLACEPASAIGRRDCEKVGGSATRPAHREGAGAREDFAAGAEIGGRPIPPNSGSAVMPIQPTGRHLSQPSW